MRAVPRILCRHKKKPSPEARETGDGLFLLCSRNTKGPPDGTDGARSRLTIRYRHGALRRSDRRAVSVVVTLSLLSSVVTTWLPFTTV